MIHLLIFGRENSFHELQLAIEDSLSDMGYKTKIFYHDKRVSPKPIIFSKDINIVINTQKVNEDIVFPKNNSIKILIQTEQSLMGQNGRRKMIYDYSKWDKVLEFFEENVKEENMVYFPLGYSRFFEGNSTPVKEDIDTFFFGAPTDRRINLTRRLGIKRSSDLIWKADRDLMIKRTKVNVNLLAFTKNYSFAPLHCLMVICKGKLFLQEKTSGYGAYKEYIELFTEDTYFDIIKYWLSHEEERLQRGREVREKLKKDLNFNKSFLNCIKGIL